MTSIDDIVTRIGTAAGAARDRAVLVGVSGIDGSGKGFLAARIERRLAESGLRVASLDVDGWLEPPDRRFEPRDPGGHFYRNGIRLDEMFARLALPLRRNRSVEVSAVMFDASNATEGRRRVFAYAAVDVVLVEGIFIFKHAYRDHFDLRFWVECTFETALERALARNQEGLPPADIVRDYETIYFPAERLHLALDDPRGRAHVVIENDPRLPGGAIASADAPRSTCATARSAAT